MCTRHFTGAKTMKKKILILSVFAALVIGTTQAFAYFTDMKQVVNPLDIGSVTTEIVEDFPDPGNPGPGDVICKRVAVRSTGKSDCYVRAQVLFSDSSMSDISTVNFNNSDWTSGEDGWWYYLNVLKSGEVTPMLFDAITISEDALDVQPFDVIVRQESHQAYGYTDCFEAWRDDYEAQI